MYPDVIRTNGSMEKISSKPPVFPWAAKIVYEKDKDIDYILENIGVLIDGPYIEEQNTGKGNLKGSDNQRIIFINQDLKPAYDKYYRDERQMQEQVLGNILLSAGIPTEDYIKKFTKNQ